MSRLLPLIAALWLLPRAALAKCEPGALVEGQRTLTTLAPELQPRLAAQTLARACTFPAPLQSALQEVATAPTVAWAAQDRRLASAMPDQWTAICPGGLTALQTALAQPPAEAHAGIFTACQVERLGFASAAEFGAAPGGLVLPLFIAQVLKDEGVDRGLVRDYARALAVVKPPWSGATP